MNLTPKQFTKILNDLFDEKVEGLATKKQVDDLQKTLDSMIKDQKTLLNENDANLGAHQAMQGQINECRKKLGLKITRPVL